MIRLLQYLESRPKTCKDCGDVSYGSRSCYVCRYRRTRGLKLYGKWNPLKTIDGVEYE